MRQFKLTSKWKEVCGIYSLYEAAMVGSREHDVDALADLEVGQTYVDSDGDTWERTKCESSS